MRKIIILIISISFFNINCSVDNIDKDIIHFEESFSKENLQDFNELVSIFDQTILKEFPSVSLDSSYLFLLHEAMLGSERFYDFISDTIKLSNCIQKLSETNIQNELVLYPDTVFFLQLQNALCRKYVYKGYHSKTTDIINDTILLPREIDGKKVDRLNLYKFLEKYNQLYLFNVYGEFYQGLYKIKNRNEFFSAYYEVKSNRFNKTGLFMETGSLPYNLTAKEILDSEIQLTDYFIKRIIMIECLTNVLHLTTAHSACR